MTISPASIARDQAGRECRVGGGTTRRFLLRRQWTVKREGVLIHAKASPNSQSGTMVASAEACHHGYHPSQSAAADQVAQ